VVTSRNPSTLNSTANIHRYIW